MTYDADRHDQPNPDQPNPDQPNPDQPNPDQPNPDQPDQPDPAPTAPLEGASGRRGAPAGPIQYMTAELCIGARRIYVRGRILGIVLWLITHQDKLNIRAAKAGQLWLTWKDGDPLAVEGEIKTKL